MSDKIEQNLFAFCLVALVALIVSLAVPDWDTCTAANPDDKKLSLCARQGLFQICPGYCIGKSSYTKSKCENISWKLWDTYAPYHKSVVILLLVCTGLHFLCCMSGIISAVTSKFRLMLINSFVDFIAAILGIAAMSLYTNKHNGTYCRYETVYFCGWAGVFMVLISSLIFFAKFGASVMERATAGDRTNLV